MSSLLEEGQGYQPEVKFPLQTRQIATTINGNHTEIIITPFSDHIFIAITQTQKLGTLVCIALLSISSRFIIVMKCDLRKKYALI